MTTSTHRNTVVIATVLALLITTGCSTTPRNAEEQEQRYFVMYDEWRSCKHAYTMANVQWVTQWSHQGINADDNRKPRYNDMRRDMRTNNCAMVLRKIGYRG